MSDDNGKSTPGSGNQLIAEIIADARAAYMQKVTRDYDIIICLLYTSPSPRD